MPIPSKQLLITCAVKSVPYIDSQCPCMHTVSLAEPDPYVGEEGLVTCYTELFCWNAIIGYFTWHHVKFILRVRTCLSFQRARNVNDNAFIIVEAHDYGNEVKLQYDWCRSVQSARTTPCIASHQTLSPPHKGLALRDYSYHHCMDKWKVGFMLGFLAQIAIKINPSVHLVTEYLLCVA